MKPEDLINRIFNTKQPEPWIYSKTIIDKQHYDDTEVGLYRFRKLHVQHSFPILDEDNTQTLSNFIKQHVVDPKAIEVMAGKGWLSYHLRQKGVNVIAVTDNYSWERFDFSSTPVPVEKLDCVEAVKKYKGANLVIMSWPYMDSNAHKVVKALRKNQWLLYIGESEYGCTADEAFFRYIRKHCVVLEAPGFKSFPEIHDFPLLIHKK